MFKNMKRKIAAVLAAISLMTVATGALADYGDAEKDRGDEPRYKVGQEVEVYNSFLHVSTSRKKILSCKKDDSGTWIYEISYEHFQPADFRGQNGSWTHTSLRNANEIQS